MKFIKDMFIKYKEIIMYLFIGGLTTVINWISYAICTKTISAGSAISNFINGSVEPDTINIFLANVISWIVAVAFAYITNKLFVFESFNWKPAFVLRELSLFISSRIITGLLEIFGVPFLVGIGLDQKLFGVEGMVCKLIVSILVVILNYVFSKLFIFKKDTPTRD